jgi:hypothetical protein
MIVSTDIGWTAKAGNSSGDYEDAFWPPEPVLRRQRSCQRFAVADGATESSFSGLWARQLVRGYGKQGWTGKDLARRLPPMQQAWQQQVQARPLPWYAEEKARAGAFSTLLGLTLQDHTGARGQGTWRALAVGDSCLFQLRQQQVLASFPLHDAAAFDNSPVLLASLAAPNQAALDAVQTVSGYWQTGDEFLLMTDALAACFLQHGDAAATWPPPTEFSAWIHDLRQRRLLRNDDVTLVRVRIEAD